METLFFDLKPLHAAYNKRESLILRLIEIGATVEWQGFVQGSLKTEKPEHSYVPITLRWRQSKPLFGRSPENERENIDTCNFLMNPRPPREVHFEHAGDPMYHGSLSLTAALRIAGHYLGQGYSGTLLVSTRGRGSHAPRLDIRFRFANFGEAIEDGNDQTRDRMRIDHDPEHPLLEPLLRLAQEFELERYHPETAAV